MQPAGLVAEPLRLQALGDRGREGDDVVLHLGLDLLNAGGGNAGFGGDGFGGRRGNHAVFGQHGARRRLHLQPAAVLVLFRPDAAHRRAGIAVDQRQLLDWLSLMAVANS